MSKELEALERIKEFYPQWRLSNRKDFNLIETALKEKENQDSVLKTLKEVIEFRKTLPQIKPNKDNGFDILSSVGLHIQRDIENRERELLRQWVLETCFPKELKALEIIKEKNIDVGYFREDFIKNNYGFSFYEEYYDNYHYGTDECCMKYRGEMLTKEEFDLLKEVLK